MSLVSLDLGNPGNPWTYPHLGNLDGIPSGWDARMILRLSKLAPTSCRDQSVVGRPSRRNALYNSVPTRSTTGDAMAEPTYEELKAKLAEMEKQGGGRRSGSLEFRVGDKGGVSVYGLGRFPVTLYYDKWIRMLDTVPNPSTFL